MVATLPYLEGAPSWLCCPCFFTLSLLTLCPCCHHQALQSLDSRSSEPSYILNNFSLSWWVGVSSSLSQPSFPSSGTKCCSSPWVHTLKNSLKLSILAAQADTSYRLVSHSQLKYRLGSYLWPSKKLPVPPWLLSIPVLSPGKKMGDQGKALPALLFFPGWCSLTGALCCFLSLRDAGFHLGEYLFFLQRTWLEDLHFSLCLSQRQLHFCAFFFLTETDHFSFQVNPADVVQLVCFSE